MMNDQEFEIFAERAAEAAALAETVEHLHRLGLRDAEVYLPDDWEVSPPCVLVFDEELTAEQASALVQRLDPRWSEDGGYARDFSGLPTDPDEPRVRDPWDGKRPPEAAWVPTRDTGVVWMRDIHGELYAVTPEHLKDGE